MLKNQQRLLLVSLIGMLCAQTAFANEINSAALMSWLQSSYVISASTGLSMEQAGQTQTLTLAPDVIKTYKANTSTYTLATNNLFFGVQTCLPKNVQGQFGLDFAGTSSAKLSGDVWDDADPAFDNYTYQYKIQHFHAALKGKLLRDFNLPVIPWISAAIGVGFNKAHAFSNTPTIFEAVSTPNFTSRTTTALTYTLGIGVQRQLNPNWQIGLGYEFADWGKSELGHADGSSSSGLSLSHLYTNSVLLNLTYLA